MRERIALRRDEVRSIVVAACVLAFSTADVLTGGPLTHLDAAIRSVAPRPGGPATWSTVALSFGDIGVAAAALVIAGLVCAHALWRLWPLVLAAGNLAVTEGAVLALKAAVGRPPPGESTVPTDYPGFFPSGHTATATVAAGTVVFLVVAWRTAAGRLVLAAQVSLGVALGIGGLTAVQAVLGDLHWASDGLGGLALGTLVLVGSLAAARTHVDATESSKARAWG